MEYKKDSVDEILDQLRNDRMRDGSASGDSDVESILASLGFGAAPKRPAQPKAASQQAKKPVEKAVLQPEKKPVEKAAAQPEKKPVAPAQPEKEEPLPKLEPRQVAQEFSPEEEEGEFVRPSPDIFSGERLDRLNSRAEELIDDQFYEFFTHSVVVDQAEIDRRMKEERRRKKKERRGWFSLGRRKKQEEPEEPEEFEEQQEQESLPQDIFAGQDDFSLAPKTPEPAPKEPPVEPVQLEKKEQPAPAEKQPEQTTRSFEAIQKEPTAPEQDLQEKQPPEAETPAPDRQPQSEAAMPETAQPAEEPAAPAEEQERTKQFERPLRPQPEEGEQDEEEAQEQQEPDLGQLPPPEEPTRYSIFGFGARELPEDEEDEEEDEQEEEEEEPMEDYDSPSDAPAVQADLKSLKTTLGLRLAATAILGVLSVYLSLTASISGLPSVPFLDASTQPLFFLMAGGLMLLVAMLVNYNTIASGVSSLWSSPSPDLLPTFASLAALVQCGVMMTNPQRFATSGYTMFASLAVLCLAGNTFGKCITARMVAENFEMASAGFDHAAAYQITDPELLKKVTDGLGEEEPRLLVSRPTALVRGFLRQSFSEHSSDRRARVLGIVGLVGGLASGAIAALVTKDAFTAVSCFAGAVVLACPLSSTLVGSIPAALMQSSAARVGAVVPGPSAVETLKNTNVVLVGARDLFPPSTVRLRGIKTFQKERIDLAILYAASILVEGCDTLRDIFLGVVEGKRDMLYPVENLVGEVGYGFMGWIENNRVIVGNREMMQRHDIEIPSMDYERRYTGEDKLPIYLAVSGRLFGMFLVSYDPDEEMTETISELRRAGISLLVRSADFNVTSELVADRYGINPESVKVLTGPELTALNPSLSYLPESEGVMTHIGSFASFIGGLRAASAAASAEKAASVVQTAAVVLGILLGLLLSVTTGLGALSPLAIILYHCAWLILTIAVPLMKRY